MLKPFAVSLIALVAGCGTNAVDDSFIQEDMAAAPGSDLAAPAGSDLATPPGADLAVQPGAKDMAMAMQGMPTVFTIVLENHDYAEIVGSQDAPYLNSLIAKYGLATHYGDNGHPSMPNYLAMASASTQGASDDRGPTTAPFPVDADNLGNQLQQAKIPWRAYQESMGSACRLGSSGNYAPKHNPFVYFKNIQNGANGLCANVDVDYSQFAADLAGGTYKYMWITPNLLSDGHDPSNDPVTGLKQSDAWCATEIPKILASTAFQNGGILFVTWDEAEGRNGDDPDKIPMIVITKNIKAAGMTSATAFDHTSYTATVEDLFGLPRLPGAKSAKSLAEFWQ
jgi:hypothetical protein